MAGQQLLDQSLQLSHRHTLTNHNRSDKVDFRSLPLRMGTKIRGIT